MPPTDAEVTAVLSHALIKLREKDLQGFSFKDDARHLGKVYVVTAWVKGFTTTFELALGDVADFVVNDVVEFEITEAVAVWSTRLKGWSPNQKKIKDITGGVCEIYLNTNDLAVYAGTQTLVWSTYNKERLRECIKDAIAIFESFPGIGVEFLATSRVHLNIVTKIMRSEFSWTVGIDSERLRQEFYNELKELRVIKNININSGNRTGLTEQEANTQNDMNNTNFKELRGL